MYSLHNYHGDTALTVTGEGKTTPDTNTLLAYGAFGEQLLPGTQGTTTAHPLNATDSTMGWAANPTRKQESSYSTTIIQMGARVYIPTLGRFLQMDPIEGGTLNGYVYVADPINSNDYSGQWGIGLLLSLVAIVRAVIKVVVTPILAIARAAAAKTVNARSVPSSGGNRATTASAPLKVQSNPAFRTGVDMFYIQRTQPPRVSNGGGAVRFDLGKAILTANDFYYGGSLVGGGAGCLVGGAGGFAAGVAAAGVGALPGAGLGCSIMGAAWAGPGGVIGAGVGFVVGGFAWSSQDTFEWGPDQVTNPWKRR